MVQANVIVQTHSGLHLRPAGALCNLAIKFKSSISFTHGSATANAKSVLSVLGSCVKMGDEITFICEGEDEEEALKAMVQAIENRLGEEND